MNMQETTGASIFITNLTSTSNTFIKKKMIINCGQETENSAFLKMS